LKYTKKKTPANSSLQNLTVVVAAKSTSDAASTSPFPPDPNSPASTISTVAREINEAGGEATPIRVDTRDYASISALVRSTLSTYGRLDILVYNSGAIWWAPVSKTPMSRFQLMQRVNIEGLYGVIQACLPHFQQRSQQQEGDNNNNKSGAKEQHRGRIIIVSPPIYSRFFRGKTAYAIGKIGMSVLTMGLAMDFSREGKTDMAVTSIWPATAIQSAATQRLAQEEAKELRTAHIFSDAVREIIKAPVQLVNGRLLLDEDFLRERGATEFEKYSLVPGTSPRRIMPAVFPDLSVREQEDEGRRMDSTKLRAAKL
jgi:NAD(P)-dependent dehydrogenase (short-subunit alcohol dehydrogenase family)